jgi:hypothetical protein
VHAGAGQIQAFLEGTGVEFQPGDDGLYAHLSAVLKRFNLPGRTRGWCCAISAAVDPPDALVLPGAYQALPPPGTGLCPPVHKPPMWRFWPRAGRITKTTVGGSGARSGTAPLSFGAEERRAGGARREHPAEDGTRRRGGRKV